MKTEEEIRNVLDGLEKKREEKELEFREAKNYYSEFRLDLLVEQLSSLDDNITTLKWVLGEIEVI